MNHPPMKPGMIEAPHRRWAAGDLRLESGERIRGFELSYVTHGKLNEARDNAVLVTVSLTGNHHRLDFLIGAGRALDTERYFVVCVDPIGNGLTSSPSNSAAQPGARFPRFCLRDMVHSQHRLLTEELHIDAPALRDRGLDGRYAGAAVGGEPSRFHALRRRHDADGADRPLGRGGGGNGAAGTHGRPGLEWRGVHRLSRTRLACVERRDERAGRPHAGRAGRGVREPAGRAAVDGQGRGRWRRQRLRCDRLAVSELGLPGARRGHHAGLSQHTGSARLDPRADAHPHPAARPVQSGAKRIRCSRCHRGGHPGRDSFAAGPSGGFEPARGGRRLPQRRDRLVRPFDPGSGPDLLRAASSAPNAAVGPAYPPGTLPANAKMHMGRAVAVPAQAPAPGRRFQEIR